MNTITLIKDNVFAIIIAKADINIGDYYWANEGIRECKDKREGKYPYFNGDSWDFHTWSKVIGYLPIDNVIKLNNLPLLPLPSKQSNDFKVEFKKEKCNCLCHTNKGMTHIVACCNNGYIKTDIPETEEIEGKIYLKGIWK